MQPRDVFDGIVVALVAVVVYLEVFGFGLSSEKVDRMVAALEGLGVEVYLVVAGIFGIFFLGYIVLYLPQKYSTDLGK
ncbi:hypothetical protein ACKVMT_08060 [Halobacteriales archaeon Cl-PHB]